LKHEVQRKLPLVAFDLFIKPKQVLKEISRSPTSPLNATFLIAADALFLRADGQKHFKLNWWGGAISTAPPIGIFMPSTPSLATYPSLRGQRVFVTGGATGIGAAVVTAFAEQGAQAGVGG
jgi:hypothetical protein